MSGWSYDACANKLISYVCWAYDTEQAVLMKPENQYYALYQVRRID